MELLTVSPCLSTIDLISLYIPKMGSGLKGSGHFKGIALKVFWDSLKGELDNLIVSSCQMNIQVKNGKYQYADGMSSVNKCES